MNKSDKLFDNGIGYDFYSLPKAEQIRLDSEFSKFEITKDLLATNINSIIEISSPVCTNFPDAIENWLCQMFAAPDKFQYLVFPEYAGFPYFENQKNRNLLYQRMAAAVTARRDAERTFEMGISSYGSHGIRMLEEFSGDITFDKRIQALQSISDVKFRQTLLLNNKKNVDDKKIDAETNQEYLHSRKLFPAYLQGELPVALFILTQLETYSKQLKSKEVSGLDFHVPKKWLNEDILGKFLSDLGYVASYKIISDKDLPCDTPFTIRIFTNCLSSDEDYQKLFYGAGETAGCSGDDTLTIALSVGNIPFFCNYQTSVANEKILNDIPIAFHF